MRKKRLPMGPGHVVSFSLRRVRSSESEFLPCQHKSPLSGKQAISGEVDQSRGQRGLTRFGCLLMHHFSETCLSETAWLAWRGSLSGDSRYS